MHQAVYYFKSILYLLYLKYILVYRLQHHKEPEAEWETEVGT